jgi:c-di-GMP-binding flagellar brake protein YcgR
LPPLEAHLARRTFGPECASERPIHLQERTNLRERNREAEHRKWQRLPLAIPIFVRSKDGNDKELLEFATALNVSAGGALVAVRRSLPLYSQVLLEIPSAPLVSTTDLPKAARNLQARIVWATRKEGYQLAGVKFSHALLSSSSNRLTRKRKVVSPV